MADDSTIEELQRKIQREKTLITANMHMRQATTNSATTEKLDEELRISRRNIDFFENTIVRLNARKMGQNMQGLSISDASSPAGPHPPAHNGPMSAGYREDYGPGAYQDQGGYLNIGPGGYSMGGGGGLMPPRGPFAPQSPMNTAMPKGRPSYSRLDLIKADTPHLGPRIQLMLSQLEFKLSVEKQYNEGIIKMSHLYQLEGDRKSRADAEAKKTESAEKIELLKRALKRHEDLHVDTGPDMQDDDSLNLPSQRKPLSGHLSIRVQQVANVDHVTFGRLSRKAETFVVVKVEDNVKGKTRATRTDRWTEEVLDFDIDKANEVEFTVYDRSGDKSQPIGMLWARVSDIAEEMRRKRIENETNQAGWRTADAMGNTPGGYDARSRPDSQGDLFSPNGGHGPRTGDMQQVAGLQPQNFPVTIDDWFSLEPVGKIKLTMNFVKQNRERRPLDLGLGRKGAIRQKKEEVVEQFGHKFVQQTFYNIMRCSLCGELLKYTAGMQCTDCRLTCHKKCYAKVVTKCISKSNSETDPDEEKINHRIPHRFEPFGNMGANWCCHCGYMLQLGRKQSRKCSECQTTCHVSCVHLVPDFCGMTMEAANQILAEIRRTKGRQATLTTSNMASRTLRPPKSGRPSPVPSQPSYVPSINSSESTLVSPDQRFSYGKEKSPDPYGQTSAASLDAAKASYSGRSNPTSPENRPSAQRTQSSQSAAAAAAMALSGRTTSVDPRSHFSRISTDHGPDKSAHSRTGSGVSQQSDARENAYNAARLSPPQQQSAYDPAAFAAASGFSAQSHGPSLTVYNQPQTPASMKPGVLSPQPADTSPHSIMASPARQSQTSAQPGKDLAVSPRKSQPAGGKVRVGLDHFNFLAVLGKGNFGKVMLAETKQSKQLYAIKVLKKEFILEGDEVESTRSEKRVFLIANKERHPFLLNLHACFQTETRIYFVMEYISGGDLMLHIQRGQFGTKRAQFYAAEVCLALKYFHENGVIYRDLKLDNILLTLDGHIKIADYGLCKEDMWYGSTTSTFCGTPEFMAPEILLDKKYGRAVDWWAFGVLIYQMLLQQSPFRGEDEDEIYDAIMTDEPLYPIHMPRDSVSILQKLLIREPDLRLGSGPSDAQEIMSHAFFRNVNWEDVYHKRIPAPFTPTVKGRTDTSNFDPEFTTVTPVLTPVQSVLTQAMQEEFRGFSYTADFA